MRHIINRKFALITIIGVLACLAQVTLSCGCSGTMGGMSATTMSSMPMVGDAYWNQVKGENFRSDGNVRHYYIQAEEVDWNYAPLGHDVTNGSAFGPDAQLFTDQGPFRIGSTYVKCLYFEYIDATFKHKKQRAPEDEYMGFLGPTIRGQVGDVLKVVFSNRCGFPASIHPHGVFYDKTGEGAPYNDTTSGRAKADDAVQPNHTYTYTWLVPGRAGPGPMDGSSVMWMYHSHTIEDVNVAAGLVGFLVISGKGMGKEDGSPIDVDREIFFMFEVVNENISPYLLLNFQRFATNGNTSDISQADAGFANSNLMHSMNGYIYGNGPVATMKKHQRVRWYVMSMGGVFDTHTPHWHGNVPTTGGMRMDVIALSAAEMKTLDMVPDDKGYWLWHCHVNEHLRDGMVSRYRVVDSHEHYCEKSWA